MTMICLCVLFLLGVSTSSMATVVATAVNPSNGHTYHILAPATWTDSEAEAITLGGHLVTINDSDENAWVEATFNEFADYFWIGYTDAATEGVWVWVDGDPSAFTNWGGIEPNDGCGSGPEDVAAMVTNGIGAANPDPILDGEWADLTDDFACGPGGPPQGIVEVGPQLPAIRPIGQAVLVLLLLGCGLTLMMRPALRSAP